MKMNPNLQDISKEHDRFVLMAKKLLGAAANDDKANEMVQEMYIKLHERLSDQSQPQLQFVSTGYIFRMLRNHLYNSTAKKQYEYLQDDDYWSSTQTYEDNELLEWRQDISAKLDEIPYLEREVLLRHQEQSQRSLQRETGVCRDRLRMYKNRALDKLKEMYNDDV
ncbi:hypothetical protein [Galbibacter pacificus]|uniref:Sigma-70 family RNA polymerase sigma factor n=1 Tax=Galbibacter pacificus TaxID=2996052 RepID=A0ABT6FQG1_9FLAO|nr:hypothetical protein [Galbibacter pacificus]MDG3582035.1 hypothetical protein [Galbibacter pacificus]MDG3585491.1 hypothetical protein [Galbibacter pacificus]